MDFNVKQGTLPTISATLLDAAGAPLNLASATVAFAARSATASLTGAATILSAAAGTVSYTFTGTQTSVAGCYEAEWTVTYAGGTVFRYPIAGYVTFEILEALTQTPASDVTPLRTLHEFVRAILGDFDSTNYRYEATTLDQCLRVVVKTGRVVGCELTADQRGITPALEDTPRLFGLAIYHTAKMILLPNAAAASFRMRALSQTFGDQRHFIFELENLLFDLENADELSCTEQFLGWIRRTTGQAGLVLP